MGRYVYYLICILIASLCNIQVQAQESANDTLVLDSSVLSQDSLFVCEEHYFEWCKVENICPYCEEPLKKIDLWTYYKKLECEECKQYFEEHYLDFIKE